jgi:hypothetical protein
MYWIGAEASGGSEKWCGNACCFVKEETRNRWKEGGGPHSFNFCRKFVGAYVTDEFM